MNVDNYFAILSCQIFVTPPSISIYLFFYSMDNSIKKKRRPHTRTSKACDLCRQQKTRCLRNNNINNNENLISCLRCTSLNLHCSLSNDLNTNNNNTNININNSLNSSNNITNPLYLPSIYNNSRNHSLSHSPIPLKHSDNSNLPLLSYTPPISSIDVTKLDIINNNVKSILNILLNNNDNLINQNSPPLSSNNPNNNNIHNNNNINNIIHHSKPLSHNSSLNSLNPIDLLPICNDPVNFTNLPIQSYSLSPINYLNSINNNSSNSNSSLQLPISLKQQLNPLHLFKPKFEDIINSNILSLNQTIHLINIFRDRYGRWLSFPSLKSTKNLIKRLRKRCPLLLTISCLLSLKYGDPLLKNKVWYKLLSIIKREIYLLNSLNSYGLEELQSLIILSAYSIILSDSSINENNKLPNLLLDGWNLSGIGLIIFEKINSIGFLDQMYGKQIENLWKINNNHSNNDNNTNNNNNNIIPNDNNTTNSVDNNEFDNDDYNNDYNNNDSDGIDEDDEEDDDEFNLLTLHRIWNTLVLIHLAYCLLYGKKSWISIEKLKPREVSDISSSTNFDFRIIAEIHIYLIAYKYLLLNDNNSNNNLNSYSDTIKSIKIWLDKWNCTFGQPSNQFVEIDYHFVEILIKLKHSKIDLNSICKIIKDNNFNIEILNNLNLNDLDNLKTHSSSIINLINTVNDDSYFAFLSDQIHLTVFFATNVLISSLTILNYLRENYLNINNLTTNSSNFDKSVLKNFIIDKELLNKIENLIFRFKTVATTKNDTFYKYYSILESNYNINLPSV